MIRHWISLGLFIALSHTFCAQGQQVGNRNLVYNPSFEEYVDCPRKIDALGILTIVDAWYQPTLGSADYYNICGSRDCSVPKNKLGIQNALDGNGYCGIYVSQEEYREYLQTQLAEPLRKGARYRLSFYVSLSEYSSGAVATIGGLFTENRVGDTTRGILMRKEVRQLSSSVSQTIYTYYQPQVVNDADKPLVDVSQWQRIEGEFVAEGGEQYLTIGNFYSTGQSNITDLDTLTYLLPGAYYYIDHVNLECLDCVADTVVSVKSSAEEETYPVGSTFVMKDIYFEFDKSTLLQQSYNELRKLLKLLAQHPTLHIEIGGHTDSRGSDNYNRRLSEMRAKSVVDYLVRHGVDARRLKYRGYGKTVPIDTNDTEEGRANNRRVEFKILSY